MKEGIKMRKLFKRFSIFLLLFILNSSFISCCTVYNPPLGLKERKFWSDFPGSKKIMSFANNNNFVRLYKRLIKNLDNDSIITVNRILARFQALNNNDKIFFTGDELNQLNMLDRSFYQEIIKLNEECYAWRNYYLPIKHFEVSVFYYKNGINNLKNLKYFKNKDIIDAGGFIGDSALIFSDYTNKNIHSFEPSSKNYELMRKTIKMNTKNNIIPINKGLGSKTCYAEIPLEVSSSLKTNQKTNLENIGNNKEIVKIIKLDDYVTQNKLNVGLIKVDIEGNEQDFLKGAEKTIKEQKPSLLISIYHNASDLFNIKPLIESWDLGYKFKIVKCIDGELCAETLLIAEIEERK